MRHPVDTVTEQNLLKSWQSSFVSILRLGSWGARRVSLAALFGCRRGTVSLLENIKQNGDYADIACLTGSRMITITQRRP